MAMLPVLAGKPSPLPRCLDLPCLSYLTVARTVMTDVPEAVGP